MSVGDLYPFDLSSTATLDFSGSSSSAQYVLLVQSAAQSAGTATASVADLAVLENAVGKSVATAAAADDLADTGSVQEQFELFLRNAESDLPHDQLTGNRATHKGVQKTVATGSQRTFRVLSSLYSTSSYTTVTATAQCVNDTVAVYIDNAADSHLTSDELATLCSQFRSGLQAEYALLGNPPDTNDDDVVTVLMTKVVNELGGSAGGIVTGFFFAGDMLDQGSSNPASNEQEIIFTLLPDPDGTYGTAIPVDFALSNLLPAVVPHEVQHLLSYYNHVLVSGGSPEAAWLNEGMAHLIEDLVGFGQENPSRVELFLAQSYSAALVPSSSPGLTERGASYLFLRFLYEQAADGSTFVQNLVQTDATGVDNVLAAIGTQDSTLDTWSEVLQRWGVAVALTDADVTADGRYVYDARTQDSATGEWHGVCLQCDADDGRGTMLSGVTTLASGTSVNIRAGAGAYYAITTPPASLTVTPGSGTSLEGILMRVEYYRP